MNGKVTCGAKSQLSLETNTDGSLQRLRSCGSSPRWRSAGAGSLPGTIVEKPSHVVSRREEVMELFIVTGGAECRLRLEAQREEPAEFRMKLCLGRAGLASGGHVDM